MISAECLRSPSGTPRRKRLLLARDPYGIKPLYYADDGWTLRFASQVKALLAGQKVSRNPEPAGWVGFCLFGSVPEPFTTYQEIRALPAGSTLWVDRVGTREVKQYFSIADAYCRAEAATRLPAMKISSSASGKRSSTACVIISWPMSRLAHFFPAESTLARWSV